MIIKRVKKVKINFRIKPKKIAEFCGVSRQTVYNWKHGRAYPHPKHEAKIRELMALYEKKE
jgi:DNA-binding XRE family transcriptional regulator